MFDFEELAKGSHFQNYIGPIPAVEYFSKYEEKEEGIRTKLLAWHTQQVAERVVYNLREEMQKYSHSDVDILQCGFQKFRERFITLQSADGKRDLR